MPSNQPTPRPAPQPGKNSSLFGGGSQAGQGLLDPSLLRELSRRQGRRYSLYFVQLGVAVLVAALLMAVAAPVVGLSVGLLVVVASVVAMAVFVNQHRHLVGQFAHLARPFWIVLALALVICLAGALWRSGGSQLHPQLVWGGGLLGLLDGLVAGHLVDRASRRATQPTGPDTATH